MSRFFEAAPLNRREIKVKNKQIVFFDCASNEVKSMSPIQNKIENSYLLGQKKFRNDFPFYSSYLIAIFFIPVVFIRFLFCKDAYLKKSFSYVFDGFCLAYAFTITLPIWLRKIQPRKIVISNQLSVYHRSLAASAHKLGIETIFMQHASVTDNFPPLTNYHTALLEGENTLDKYQKNGSKNLNIYLIGMAKFDYYYGIVNKKAIVENIGICTNGMDNIDRFEELINKISLLNDIKNIYLRPHPSDRRFEQWSKISIRYNIKFSNVRVVNSFDFLGKVDLIIAGDSNILLEAALMNVSCIYFDSLNSNHDWYGFNKNGLVDYFNKIDLLLIRVGELIIDKKTTRNIAKKYIETINTSFEGRSSQLAANIINDLDMKDSFVSNKDDNYNTVYKINN